MNDTTLHEKSQIIILINYLLKFKFTILSLALLLSVAGTAIIFYDYVIQTESKYLIAPVTIKEKDNKDVPIESLININTVSRAIKDSNMNLVPSEVLKNVSLINSSILIDPLLLDLNNNSSQYIKENLANRSSLEDVSLRLQEIKSNHYKILLNIDKMNTGLAQEQILLTNIIKSMNVEASIMFDFTKSGLKDINKINNNQPLDKNLLLSLPFSAT